MPFCDLAGHRLFYTHNGVASRGANLVLIHGAGGQARSWPATWRLAGDAARSTGLSVGVAPGRLTNHSTYAVDLPGHGRSPAPPLSTIEAIADHLEAFFEAQALDRVIPVGHSMGGLVALELARRANPRLVGQVIVASSARLAVTDQILDGLRSPGRTVLSRQGARVLDRCWRRCDTRGLRGLCRGRPPPRLA